MVDTSSKTVVSSCGYQPDRSSSVDFFKISLSKNKTDFYNYIQHFLLQHRVTLLGINLAKVDWSYKTEQLKHHLDRISMKCILDQFGYN